jgi:hypothetical protein
MFLVAKKIQSWRRWDDFFLFLERSFTLAAQRMRSPKREHGVIFFWWRGLIHIKGARASAASTPIGPRARL